MQQLKTLRHLSLSRILFMYFKEKFCIYTLRTLEDVDFFITQVDHEV